MLKRAFVNLRPAQAQIQPNALEPTVRFGTQFAASAQSAPVTPTATQRLARLVTLPVCVSLAKPHVIPALQEHVEAQLLTASKIAVWSVSALATALPGSFACREPVVSLRAAPWTPPSALLELLVKTASARRTKVVAHVILPTPLLAQPAPSAIRFREHAAAISVVALAAAFATQIVPVTVA